MFTQIEPKQAPIQVEVDGIPFVSTCNYYGTPGTRELCHAVKEGNKVAIVVVAHKLAVYVPRHGVVLVPTPSHHGYATESLDICNAISELTGIPVVDALKGKSRQSQYYSKKEGHPLTENEMGIRQVKPLPLGKTPFVVDTVSDTATTALASAHALKQGTVLTLAVTDNLLSKSTRKKSVDSSVHIR